MSTATATSVGSRDAGTPWVLLGIRNGLVASVAMAMVMMVLGVFDTGFFAAPSSIWAFFAGPGAYTPHSLSLSFVIGAIGHMMNSAVLGIVFAYLASRVLGIGGVLPAIVAGTAFALVAMAIMFAAVLPAFPNGAIVIGSAALWIWVLGHVAYGMTGGLLYSVWR